MQTAPCPPCVQFLESRWKDCWSTIFTYRFCFSCPLPYGRIWEKGRHVDEAPSTAERRRQKEAGVMGECIFYCLFDLCGFDPLKNMVIDTMHAVILSLVRSELEDHLEMADLGIKATSLTWSIRSWTFRCQGSHEVFASGPEIRTDRSLQLVLRIIVVERVNLDTGSQKNFRSLCL